VVVAFVYNASFTNVLYIRSLVQRITISTTKSKIVFLHKGLRRLPYNNLIVLTEKN